VRWGRVLVVALAIVHVGAAAAEQDFDFDVGRYERTPYEIHGYAQGTVGHLRMNRDSAAYASSFNDRDGPGGFERYQGLLELTGLYRLERTTLHGRVQAAGLYDELATSRDFTAHELFAHFRRDERLSAEIGKRTRRWGTGYAFNPVGFLERPKDPIDPELAREGFVMASAEYVRSFPGALQTVAFTPVVLPVTGSINPDFGPRKGLNLAAHAYLLYRNTDIHLTTRGQGSQPAALGAAFAHNLAPHVEIHGELAWFKRRKVMVLAEESLESRRARAMDLLLGMRYLTAGETTWIVEYYHNGAGFTGAEMTRFFSLSKEAVDDPELRALAQDSRRAGYGEPQAMRNYLHLRARHNAPWEALHWRVGLTSLVNLDDGSASIIPEVVWSGVENLELRGRLAKLAGPSDSDFGERLSRWRVELQARYYF
jgi:hypothetical protein